MNFANKLTVLFSIIFLSAGAAIAYLSFPSHLKMIETQIKDKYEEMAFNSMDKLDREIYERYADMTFLARDRIISSRSYTQKQITERLMEHKNQARIYSSLSFFDLNRIRIADTDGEDIGKQHPLIIYWTGIQEGKDFVTEVSISASRKIPVMHIAVVVKDEKGLKFGVIVSRIAVEELYALLKSAAGIHKDEPEKEVKVDLIDKNGLILYPSYNKNGMLKDTAPYWEIIKKFLSTGKKTISGIHRHPDGEKHIFIFAREPGYRNFKGNDWTLAIHIPRRVVFAPSFELRNRMIGLLSIGGIVAILIIYLFSRTISKPLERLRRVADEIGKGNLNVKVEVESKDEIGDLAASFNRMAAQLVESHEKISRLVSTIEQAAESIVITDLNGDIIYANPFFEEVTGYSASEALGKNLRILKSGYQDHAFYKELWDTITSGNIWRGLFVNKRKDGSLYNEEAVIFPVQDSSGKIINYAAVKRDITERKRAEAALQASEQSYKELTEVLGKSLNELKEREQSLLKSKDAFLNMLEDVNETYNELATAYDATIEGWSRALDYRDKDTEGHSLRVTEMAIEIARVAGMTEEELVHVRRGALLHDIGKLGVPDSILLKPGKLTEEEWEIMKKHPMIAYGLLSPIAFLRPALDIPYCHHEKWDGTGYPQGLKAEHIPFAAQIFAIVDVWDALRSDRPYRTAWPSEKAKDYIISMKGIQFNPGLVELFFKVIDR